MSKNKGALEECLSRRQVATLLHCHIETIKRREKQGKLHPLYFSTRMVRYRLSEVLALEREATQGDGDVLTTDKAATEMNKSSVFGVRVPASSKPPSRAPGVRMKKGSARQKRSAPIPQPSPGPAGVKVDFRDLP